MDTVRTEQLLELLVWSPPSKAQLGTPGGLRESVMRCLFVPL